MTALLPPDDLLAQTLDASGAVARAYSRREAVELYTAAGANGAGSVGAALAAALKYDSRRAPGVRSWVIFGTGHPTLQTLIFPALKGCPPGNRGCVDWSGKPTAICIDGDGVGTNTSLQAPAAWAAAHTVSLEATRAGSESGSGGDSPSDSPGRLTGRDTFPCPSSSLALPPTSGLGLSPCPPPSGSGSSGTPSSLSPAPLSAA